MRKAAARFTATSRSVAATWECALRISPPGDPAPESLLAFQITVCPIRRNTDPYGFVLTYRPLGATRDVVENTLRVLHEAQPGLPYAIHSNIKRLIPRDGPGRLYPLAPEEEFTPTPSVDLYVPEGDAAQDVLREAGRLLNQASISFREVPVPADQPLVADFGGLTFEGLQGVRDLIAMLESMSQAFIREARKTLPHHFADRPSR